MPTQIRLIDGTTLHVADENQKEDDVIKRLGGRDGSHPAGFVHIQATEGSYRIRPEHVTYVRWVDEKPRQGFAGGVE
jgi:hypothetical protein